MISGIVAILGRPNVGKSTLFNRLTRSDAAIVDDRPGVTRDRIYGNVWLEDDRSRGFMLIDTGGFEKDDYKFQPFSENLVWQQTEAAVQESDLVLLVLDGKSGVHPHDRELVRYLEKTSKPYLVAVNKVDGMEQGQQALWEFYELGVDGLIPLSAAHNRGVGDLKDTLDDKLHTLADVSAIKHDPNAVRIAIIGRPNAGKSSILNRLIGEERALVSEIAGTTRDAIDTPMNYNGKPYVLIDTAGMRRKSKIDDRVESLSVIRSIRAMERADVVFLIIDAVAGLTEQDMRLADLASDRHKPLAIIVNKWDLVQEKDSNSAKEYTADIHDLLRRLAFVPVMYVSALENQRVHKLMALAEKLNDYSQHRAETSKVNAALRTIVHEHTPALIRGRTKRIKFYFATQVAIAPPTIVVFTNVAGEMHKSYVRYMENRFRKMLGFDEVPIRLIYRGKTDVRSRDTREAEVWERSEDTAAVKKAAAIALTAANAGDIIWEGEGVYRDDEDDDDVGESIQVGD